jgi:hypothetical protein
LNYGYKNEVEVKDDVQSIECMNDYLILFIRRKAKEEIANGESKKGAA